MKKINVGCGRDIKRGWINLDSHDKNGANLVFDLNGLFSGEKLPFKDNHFDYVYCSHVIEDFVEPMTIVDELIRICKIGGKIELRTPSEANLHLTNPYHKIPFPLFKFKSIATKLENYGKEYCLGIEKLCYYADYNRGFLYNLFLKLNVFFYNLLGYRVVERTFIKYLFAFVDCKVIFKKLPPKIKV